MLLYCTFVQMNESSDSGGEKELTNFDWNQQSFGCSWNEYGQTFIPTLIPTLESVDAEWWVLKKRLNKGHEATKKINKLFTNLASVKTESVQCKSLEYWGNRKGSLFIHDSTDHVHAFRLAFFNDFYGCFHAFRLIQWQLVSSQFAGGWSVDCWQQKNEVVRGGLLIRFYFQWFEYGWVNHFHRCESEWK